MLNKLDCPSHAQEFVVTKDGKTLFTRYWKGNQKAPVLLLGHTQPTHSGHFLDIANALNTHGWNVHAGDLRAHGNSTASGMPLAHLDPQEGWQHLIEDMRLLADKAFDGVPFENRIIAAQNITALLVLELLKTNPDLAKHIVLSAPANQKVTALLSRAFVTARRRLNADDVPDEHMLNHFYNFLGARLPSRRHLGDVMSANESTVDAIMEDPLGFPTPTLGYWASIFKGNDVAWDWPRGRCINPETRFLLLNGVEDAVGQGGQAKKITAWLKQTGATDITFYQVQGGRSAILLDENTLNISSIITNWVQEAEELSHSPLDDDLSMQAISKAVLERLGSTDIDHSSELDTQDLIALCYEAIENEEKWVEILYRLSLSMSDKELADISEYEQTLLSLMPHMERSYEINRQMMQNAALGVVLQSVIDRLDIGTALISGDQRVLYHNQAFEEAMNTIEDENPLLESNMDKRLKTLLDKEFFDRMRRKEEDIVLTHDGHPIGFFFKPGAVKQFSGNAAPSGLIVLRKKSSEDTALPSARLSMLELAYGFTPHEAAVALEISNGLSPNAIAEKLCVSINTIRTHLKKAYEKMNVDGQTEMAARILSGPIGWLAG